MNVTGPHPTAEQWQQFLEDPATPQAEALRFHLDQCQACQAVLEQYLGARADQLLGESLPDAATVPLATDSGTRFLERLALQPPSGNGEPTWDLPARLGPFRLLRQIGQGATGVVFQAVDEDLQRTVAIKVLRPDLAAVPTGRARFVAEARAAAALQHPNVVTIHAVVNERAAPPYLVLEFIQGETLACRLRSPAKPSSAETVRVVRDVARGVGCAHAAGIVHRDVKPGNILLGRTGEVKVADFGLARVVASVGLHEARPGPRPLLGTLPYMSPEQILDPDAVDARTDVYSLGVILHEMLIGRPPFTATGEELLEQITSREPAPVRQLRPDIPEDLETILLACLAREPAFRYASAAELAVDLNRFFQGSPVRFRRPTWGRRLEHWACRHPRLTLTASLVLLCVGAILVGLGWIAAGARHDREQLVHARQELKQLAQTNRAAAAERDLERGLSLCERGNPAGGLLWLARALESTPADAPELERSIRLQIAVWNREIHPLREWLEHPGPVYSVAFTPNGQRLVSGCDDRGLRLWELPAHRLLRTLPHRRAVSSVAVTPDGLTLLVRTKNAVEFWDETTADGLGHVNRKATPEGARFHETCFGFEGEGVFSLDGRCLLTVSKELTAQLWDARSQKLGPEWKLPAPAQSLALSPDGRALLTGHADHTVRLWDTETGRLRHQWRHAAEVTTVAFNPRGDRFLSASKDHTVRLWATATTEPVGPVLWHLDKVYSACFSPDGGTLLTGSKDYTARLWDAVTGQQRGGVCWHEGPVFSIAVRPDGRGFATAGGDHSLRLWAISDRQPQLISLPFTTSVLTGVFRPDGGSVLFGDEGDYGGMWSLNDAAAVWRETNVAGAAFRPDGKLVAVPHRGGTLRLIWAETGAVAPMLLPYRPLARSLAFSPDGRWILTGGDDRDRIVRLWDAATGALRWESTPRGGAVTSVAFSPDGTRILTGCWDGTAQIWESDRGRPLGEQLRHRGAISAVAFRPDGRALLTASRDATVQVWDTETGRALGRPLHHEQPITAAAFSPDGGLIATGSEDGTARLWDAAAGRPTGSALPHPAPVHVVAFHPDGRQLLVAGDPKVAHLWELAAVVEDTPERLRWRLEVETGLWLDEDGRLQSLDWTTWRTRREVLNRLTQLHGP